MVEFLETAADDRSRFHTLMELAEVQAGPLEESLHAVDTLKRALAIGQNRIRSIEYAAEHLHAPLLVVLGHSKCGAVKATVEGGQIPPNIGAIAAKIDPAVKAVEATGVKDKDKIVEEAVLENVKLAVKDIEANSPILKELVEQKKFKIVAGKYQLDTGKVEFLNLAENK